MAGKAGETTRRRRRAEAARATVREPAGPGGAAHLDPLVHERARLGIVSALAATDRMRFSELRALLGLTDGNLSVHARRLEEAGHVAVEKSFEGRVPKTEFRLTTRGRAALERYLREMEALIRRLRPRGA